MGEIERNQYTYIFTSHDIIVSWYSCTGSSKAGIGFSMSWRAQSMSSRRRKQSWKWPAVAAFDQSRGTHLVLIVSAPWYFADASNVKLSTKTSDIIEGSLADKNSLYFVFRTDTLIAQHDAHFVSSCQPPRLGGRSHGAPDNAHGDIAQIHFFISCMGYWYRPDTSPWQTNQCGRLRQNFSH